MLIKIIRWILGYAMFMVKGGFQEQFLNLAVRRGINIWDIKKVSGNFSGKILAGEYKYLRPIARQSDARVKLKKKYGFPFFILKYRKRKGILLGILSFIGVLYFLSMYIWSIDVTGNDVMSTEEILSVMQELGVSTGSLKSMIDVPIVRQQAMSKLKGASWLSVNINGSYANVAIKEKIPPPEIVPKAKPCNIKASMDGQIDRVEAYRGTAVVNNGDAVLKGQLLISGIVENSFGGNTFVHSDGKAYAYTKRKLEERVGLSQISCQDTGKIIKRYRIKIFGIEIPIRLWHKPDENYRMEFYCNNINIKNIKLPVTIYKEEWYEQTFSGRELSYEQALQDAMKNIEKKEKNEFNNIEIIKKDVSQKEEEGVCIVGVEYTCRENIGEKEEIIFEST